MIVSLIILLVLACLGGIFWGLKEKGRLYSFPFLATLVCCGWVFPQVIALSQKENIPENGFFSILIMAILSLVMIFTAYYSLPFFERIYVKSPLLKKFLDNHYSEKRLKVLCFVLAILGLLFYVKIAMLPKSAKAMQWTGIVIAYWFFAILFRYGVAISLLKFIDKRMKGFGLLLMLSLTPMLWHIIGNGRRGMLIELCLMVTLGVFFIKDYECPRWLFMSAFFLAMLLLPSAGNYRQVMKGSRKITEVNVFENFAYIHMKNAGELKNASYEVAAIKDLKAYDYGLFHWNEFIHNYVPAQIVGRDFKESLTVSTVDFKDFMLENYNFYYHHTGGDSLNDVRQEARRRDVALPDYSHNGTTSTGFKDAFQSFWYFGCLKFFFISLCMCFFFKRAKEGQFLFQLLYMLLVVASLHSITHHTHFFVGQWPHMLVFLLPGLLWAKNTLEDDKKNLNDEGSRVPGQ
jgi:hypothetical protein